MPTIDKFTREQAEDLFYNDSHYIYDTYWSDMRDAAEYIICGMLDEDKYSCLTYFCRQTLKAAPQKGIDHSLRRLDPCMEEVGGGIEISGFDLELDRVNLPKAVPSLRAHVGLTTADLTVLAAAAACFGAAVLPTFEVRENHRSSRTIEIGGLLLSNRRADLTDEDAATIRDDIREEYEASEEDPTYADKTIELFRLHAKELVPTLCGANPHHMFPTTVDLFEPLMRVIDKFVVYYTDFIDSVESALAAESEYLQSFECWYESMLANEVEFDAPEGEDNE